MTNFEHMETKQLSLKEKMHLKAVRLIDTGAMSKTELADKVGIQRATLYTRLEKMNWKIGELYVLQSI